MVLQSKDFANITQILRFLGFSFHRINGELRQNHKINSETIYILHAEPNFTDV